jgi:hypothetical protein
MAGAAAGAAGGAVRCGAGAADFAASAANTGANEQVERGKHGQRDQLLHTVLLEMSGIDFVASAVASIALRDIEATG